MKDDHANAPRDFGEIPLNRSSQKKIPERNTAVALQQDGDKRAAPRVTAAGRGKIAETILQLAFAHDVKVREDGELAEMLAKIEIDSPIPSEAFTAVAEILSYVYRANGEKDPFDAILERFEEE